VACHLLLQRTSVHASIIFSRCTKLICSVVSLICEKTRPTKALGGRIQGFQVCCGAVPCCTYGLPNIIVRRMAFGAPCPIGWASVRFSVSLSSPCCRRESQAYREGSKLAIFAWYRHFRRRDLGLCFFCSIGENHSWLRWISLKH